MKKLEKISEEFNKSLPNGTLVSLADIIIIGGCAAVEKAAVSGGYKAKLSLSLGRTDATQETTDTDSFSVLEPSSCGFRNYFDDKKSENLLEQFVERAKFLTLSAPEMTVLVAGLRVLNANNNGSELGVFTDRSGVLTNDFFINLLDMSVEWAPCENEEHVFEGRDIGSGTVKWKASSFDLIFGSNSQLRAIAEVYASDNAGQAFVDSFIAAWSKVMELDRFDLNGLPV